MKRWERNDYRRGPGSAAEWWTIGAVALVVALAIVMGAGK